MKNKLLLIILTCLAVASCSTSNNKNTLKPNIVLIVADDAGFSDISCYGGEIPTPDIDKLAESGIMLTDFHVTPNCAPTRAALLAGMDNHLAGLGTMSELITDNQQGKPGYEGYLNFNISSLPEILSQSGYNTYMTGKWHLGAKQKEMRPYGRGFKRTFAMLAGGASHWSDNTPLIPGKASPYTVNGELVNALPSDFYSSKNYTDSIISFIDTDKKDGKPFFAYLAFTAPHNPLHAPQEYIDKYKGKYDLGWEELAKKRLENMKALGIIDNNQNAYPLPDWIMKWNELNDEQKALRARDMEVYAAMIDYMDMCIGRLISYLKSIEQYDNTMIVFISDNGASKTTIMDYASLGGEVEEHLRSFDNSLDNKGQTNSAIDIGPAWAWACNTPFRLTKGYPTEGGMRVPCIIKMPQSNNLNVKKLSGFAFVSDLMPTILELTEIEHPFNRNNNKCLPMQGISVLKELESNTKTLKDRNFGFEIYGMQTFRSGNWKINKLPVPYGNGKWQLYDLKSDISEQADLSEHFPEKLNELIEEYLRYFKNNGVVIPNKPVGYAVPPKANAY